MIIRRSVQFLILCALMLVAVSAYSDQQAYISLPDTIRTVKVLEQQNEFVDYCSLCDGSTPQIIQIESVKTVFTNYEGFWELYINDQPIDLAYAYIFIDGAWVNLAYYMSLEVDSVP